MSSTEALRLELDAQRVELQQLRAENRKLRIEHPGEAELVDLRSDLERTKELYEGSLQALQEKDDEVTQILNELVTLHEQTDTQRREAEEESQRLREQAEEAERERRRWEDEYRKVQVALETTQRESELARYRAVDEERAKGEEREARLVAQLKELRERRVHALGEESQVIEVQREGCTVMLQEGTVWLHEVRVWECMVGLHLEPWNLPLRLL